MREIDQMLNRIHKLTKHGYDGKKEKVHHESHPQVLTPEQEKDHQKDQEQKKEHQEASHEVQEKKPQEHATELHNHHEIHKKLDDSRPKRLALHRLQHKAHVLHAEHKAKAHKHVNKALEEAMAAESAAMHSDIKKKSPVSEAKRKGIEAKMKKLQSIRAQITKDFAQVTKFGKKAGYLPPVKMPQM